MKATEENPVPEFPRAMRAAFGRRDKEFRRLYSLYLLDRTNENLSTALSLHKARNTASFQLMNGMHALKYAARRCIENRRMQA